MSYAKKLVEGGTIMLVMQAVTGLIAYGLRLFLARSLSVEEYGLLYAVISFTGFFTLFRDLGFGPALTRYVSEFKEKGDYASIKAALLIVLGIELLSGFLITCVMFLLSDWLSVVYFKADAAAVLKFMILSFAISGLFAIQYVFQGLGKIKAYSFVETLRTGLTLMFAFVLIGYGIAGVAAAYLAVAIVAPLILFVIMLKFIPFFSVKAKFSKDLAKKLSRFSFYVLFASVGGAILGYTDTLVITYFLTVKDVGLYQSALPTSQFLWVITGSISVALMPIVTTLWTRKDIKTLSTIISLLLKFTFIVVVPFVLVMATFPDIIINILFGPEYLAAAPALQVLVVTSIFYTIYSIIVSTMFGIGKPEIYFKLTLSLASMDLLLNVIFVPLYGIVGAALTTLVSFMIGSLIAVKYLKKDLPFRFLWVDMAKALIGGILLFIVFIKLKEILVMEVMTEAAIISVAGFVVYTLFLYYSKAINKNDMEVLSQAGLKIPKRIMDLF